MERQQQYQEICTGNCRIVSIGFYTKTADDECYTEYRFVSMSHFFTQKNLLQLLTISIFPTEYYMMIEVIEPAWLEFVAKINKVSDVDDVLLIHQDFLAICLHNCMLKCPDLLRAVIKLCNICLNFCKFMQVSHNVSGARFFYWLIVFPF